MNYKTKINIHIMGSNWYIPKNVIIEVEDSFNAKEKNELCVIKCVDIKDGNISSYKLDKEFCQLILDKYCKEVRNEII